MTEVCAIFGRSRVSIYKDVNAGRLPPLLRIGRSIKWKESDIEAALDRFMAKRDEAA